MRNLNQIIDKIDKYIGEKDKTREQALRLSREIIIKCRKAIQCLHTKSWKEAMEFINQSSTELAKLYDVTKKFSDLYHAGFVENAAQEYVEAQCLYNLMRGEELPDPDALKTTYNAYLLGLCDVIGELRRGALDSILQEEMEKANEYLKNMDSIYNSIMSLDYPSGLIPIKRKQDIARNLIERTRGELAVASCEQRIGDKTNEFRGLLDEANHQQKIEKKKQKNTADIDIDKVW